MKSIPLSALAERTKGPKIKPATPTMPTGRKLDELRIHPADNGYVIHTSTTPIKPAGGKGEGNLSSYETPHQTVFSGPGAHAQAAGHIASVLAEHAERVKSSK